MYTRNTRNTQRSQNQRYNPPPGYMGNTFSVKHHVPENNIDDQTPRRLQEDTVSSENILTPEDSVSSADSEIGIRGENAPPDSNPLTCTGEDKNQNGEAANTPAEIVRNHDKSPINELIESLRGKIGSEELIILMVMLLIASDGLCAEVLILGLCLIAG